MVNYTLLGFAASFSSFLLDSKVGRQINRIILFGSVARGDVTKESDVDIFIDAPEEYKPEVEKTLNLFHLSQAYKLWQLKGITHEISLKIGQLKKWKLRREIISSGIILYGKFKELPEKTEFYALIELQGLVNKKTSQQVQFWRKLYGYKQRIGKNTYTTRGLVEQCGGRKLGKGVILIPMNKRQEILAFLNKQKIKYSIYEIWSDSF